MTVRPFEAVICPVAVIISPTALPKVTLLLNSALPSTLTLVEAFMSIVGAVRSSVAPALISNLPSDGALRNSSPAASKKEILVPAPTIANSFAEESHNANLSEEAPITLKS